MFDQIELYTTMLIKDNGAYASGVFVKVFGKHFILSAAHNFNDDPEGNFTFTAKDGSIMHLNGILTFLPNDHHPDLDLAILEITSSEIINMIQFYDADYDHAYFYGRHKIPGIGLNFFVYGFPSNEQRQEGDQQRLQPFKLISKENADIRPIFDRSNFIYVQCDLDNLYREGVLEPLQGPLLFGCSGGGIWQESVEGKVALRGIMTEYTHYLRIIKGTRVEHAFQLILNAHMNL